MDPAQDEESRTAVWFACHTRSRHEKRACAQLEVRGFEAFLPVIVRTTRWADRTRRVRWPMYPGYIFVRCPPVEMTTALGIPAIAGVVRFDGRPAVIPDEELDNIRGFAAALAKWDGDPVLTQLPDVGQVVRVVSGPFKGITGIVFEHRNRSRLVVGLTAVNQAIEVDLPAAIVEPIAA